LVPFYSKSKEGITSVVKKERRRDKIKSIGTGRFPRSGQWRNCCQSMVESRGSDSNVELNDTRSNQTSSSMCSHLEESNYMKKLLKNTKKKREEGIRSRAQETGWFPRSVNEETVANQWQRAEAVTPM
jgi:hypothetical protein